MTTQGPKFSVLNETTTQILEEASSEPISTSSEGKTPEPSLTAFSRALAGLSAKFNEAHPDDNLPNRSPEQQLLIAIIHRAVLDALAAPIIYPSDKTAKHRTKANALEWLSSPSLEDFSFLWCLQHIVGDVDLEHIQSKVVEFCVSSEARKTRLMDHYGKESYDYIRARPRLWSKTVS